MGDGRLQLPAMPPLQSNLPEAQHQHYFAAAAATFDCAWWAVERRSHINFRQIVLNQSHIQI